jgi:hypothetical protein
MANYEIEKTKDFTFEVYRLDEYNASPISNKPDINIRKYWIATFAFKKDAVAFTKSLIPTSIKGE